MEHESLTPFSLEPLDSAGARWERWLRRFDNFIVAKDIDNDARCKAMLLHYAGEPVFDLSESIGIVGGDTLLQTKTKLTAYFAPRRNVEFEVFTFRQAKQQALETLDQFHARLQGLAKNCEFHDKDREVKSQIVQTCQLKKVREKGLSQIDITLEQLLIFGRTLEATTQQSKVISNSESVAIHVLQQNTHPPLWRGRGRRGGFHQVTTSQHRAAQHHNSQPHHSTCVGCGGSPHDRKKECRAWGRECHKCHKKNHFSKVCILGQNTNFLKESSEDSMSQTDEITDSGDITEGTYNLSLFHTASQVRQVNPYMCTVEMEGIPMSMEIDTGASSTIVSEKQWKKLTALAPHLVLNDDNLPKLRTYAGEFIKPLGKTTAQVSHGGQQKWLPILVVPGTGPNLLGRDWLAVLKLNWATVNQVNKDDFLRPYQAVFQEGLGTLKGVTAKFYIDDTVKPMYVKACTVPLALRAKVEEELDRLQQTGVIRPVEFAEWAAPIVPVLKSTGEVRICGDYKVTINRAVKVDKYPNINDIYAKLSGGQLYSKLDLSHAYQQVVLDKDSQRLTTINTSKGLFVYERLPFGVSSSPGIFQRIMEQLLQNIPMTAVYLDDVLVTGRTAEEHDRNLEMVLTRLQDAGLHLKESKCIFRQTSCTYLGHKIDAEGIHPTKDKVMAIINAPEPKNEKELRSYLGLIHYYHNFLRNLSTLLAPLHECLKKGNTWTWGAQESKAFKDSKALLGSSQLLVHYDPKLPIVLSNDASPYGLGSVLSHRLPDGRDRPIAYASRTLSPAEKNYGQVEKEALAMVYGVTKFHKYLYGREFLLQTDHKPLLGLLKEDKQIPAMASARIQRWALTLSNYQYILEHTPGTKMGHADGMSRLPSMGAPLEVPVPEEVILALNMLDESPVTAKKIAQWTLKDPILVQVRQFIEQGWPSETGREFAPYSSRKEELSIQQGVLMWGTRVVVPPQARDTMLDELHFTHPGIVRMKGLARSYLWWPGLNEEIENKIRDCQVCQLHNNIPPSAPLHPWEWPGQPWHRVHVDYAGPFEGHMILVIVDAHSKFIDAHVVSTATTNITLTKLRQTFAMLGLPTTIVSDNGSCFTSEEFQKFCKANGIKHVTVSPYHPASNGLAERAVQTVKRGLKKSSGKLEDRLYRFLSMYRITPQSTTGQAPADLVMKYKPRTRLDLIQPSLHQRVLTKQGYDMQRHNVHAKDRVFYAGDPVWAMNFQGSPKWMQGVLEQQLGPVSYLVRLRDGRLWRRHQDHLKTRRPEENDNIEREQAPVVTSDESTPPMCVAPMPALVETHVDEKVTTSGQVPPEETVTKAAAPSDASPHVIETSPQVIRRSGRVIKPPEKLNL